MPTGRLERALLAEQGLWRLLDEVAPGVRYDAALPRTVSLLPSDSVAPIIVQVDERRHTIIAHPPLASGGSTDAGAQLRDIARAVGDGTRMRLVQELRQGPLTLGELCERTGNPRTTLLHHLALLRGAGVVRVDVPPGAPNIYHLRPEGSSCSPDWHVRSRCPAIEGIDSVSRNLDTLLDYDYGRHVRRPIRALLALLASLALTACSPGHEKAAAPSAIPSEHRDPASGPLRVDVGSRPVGLAVDSEGAVWSVSYDSAELTRIPAGADAPDLTVPAGKVPLRVVAAFDAIWVTSFGNGLLLQIDPTSGRVLRRVSVGAEPEGVAAGFGSLWVVTQAAGRLVRVDPHTGEAIAQIPIGTGARLVTRGSGAVWVGQFQDHRVLRIDPDTGAVTRSGRVCAGLQDLAVIRRTVWVTCLFDNAVVGLDADTLREQQRVKIAGVPDAIERVGDLLVVAAEDGPTVSVLDASTGQLVSSRRLADTPPLYDQANIDVVVAGEQVWVSDNAADALWRAPWPH
ncbi:MAG: helix-turn-helix domain-containing protein [Nocardioides sp.]